MEKDPKDVKTLIVPTAPQPSIFSSWVDWFKELLGLKKYVGGLRVPVFVMMQLDYAVEGRPYKDSVVEQQLKWLKEAGTEGIMVDVWWGLCEPKPKVYDFAKYIALADLCKKIGLKMQATMSFHKCGGNVGDDVTINLPSWVVATGDIHQTWFTDGNGLSINEYITFGADQLPIFPDPSVPGMGVPDTPRRTPVEMYGDFMEAFAVALGGHIGTTIQEIQVGVGPCGEARYSAYHPASGWHFPGMGAWQCFDPHLRKALTEKVKADGKPDAFATLPSYPTDYNDSPLTNPFFKEDEGEWETEQGRYLLSWYSQMLNEHVDRVLQKAVQVFQGKDIHLSCKVAGIHWWYKTKSHATECLCGYYNVDGRNGYEDLAKVFAKHHVIFDFTCLEMQDRKQLTAAKCSPESLVKQVCSTIRDYELDFAGENALETHGWQEYKQIASVYKQNLDTGKAFTYLRNGPSLFRFFHYSRFKKFIQMMDHLQ